MVNYENTMKPTDTELRDAYCSMSIPAMRRHFRVGNPMLLKWFEEYGIEQIRYTDRRHYPEITAEQREMVLGTMLGDASLRMNGQQARLRITHSLKQHEYLTNKQICLGALCQGSVAVNSNAHQSGTSYFKQHKSRAIYSMGHPWLTDLWDQLYSTGRKSPSMAYLRQFTPRSLAYWFMDDGCIANNRRSFAFQIATYSFNIQEHILIQQWLREQFAVVADITPHKKTKYLIRFDSTQAPILRDLIAPFIIPSLQYKIVARCERD